MPSRAEHFLKPTDGLAPVKTRRSVNLGENLNTPTPFSFYEPITDFLDQPREISSAFGFGINADYQDEHEPLSEIPSNSLITPFEGILEPRQEVQAEGKRRLVSSRPTSRVASHLRNHNDAFARTHSAGGNSFKSHELLTLANEWYSWTLDGGQSMKTVTLRKMQIGRLQWFLEQAGYTNCGSREMRHFFRHLRDGWQLPAGRWGTGADNKGKEILRPATLATYDRHFRSFFNFLITSEIISSSPMDELPRQKDSDDQVEPYSIDHIKAYIRAAQASKYPKRNEAIVRFLLDTGVRAEELCGLRMGRVDLFGRRARVLGKGNRNRIVSWGRDTGMVLRAYIREEYFADRDFKPDDPLFITSQGINAGEAMTYTALRLLISKMGKRAGIQVARCSPHVFRHTFAIWFLRRGGEFNVLQMILGHNSPKATQIYAKYGRADLEAQQRMYSPGDALREL